MSSSIPAAVAYLVGLAQQSVTGIAGAVVADGWSEEPSATMFGVGADVPPFFESESTPIEGTPNWAGLGAKHADENFAVPCYIYVGAGGAVEATVRAAAFVIWDAFYPKFIADITLGGALKGWAGIEHFTAHGPRTPLEAEGGRFCLIQFGVQCTNRI